MKLTKFEHACLVLEENGQKLIIDPGVYSPSIKDFSNVVGVVVTHVHPDHFDREKLGAIIAQNPSAKIMTVPALAQELQAPLTADVVHEGEMREVGPFKLEFFGSQHAIIHSSYPTTDNVGVMINDTLYYPGDSFTLPSKPVKILAVPAAAPWIKLGEAMDFISEVKAQQVFPTHNAVLSDIGASIHDRMLSASTEQSGGTYVPLKPEDSLEIG